MTHGFLITNAGGEQVAATEHFEDALALMRGLLSASKVVRRSDGELLATKPGPIVTTRVRGAA